MVYLLLVKWQSITESLMKEADEGDREIRVKGQRREPQILTYKI